MNTKSFLGLICFWALSTMAISQAQVDPAIRHQLDAYIDFSNQRQWDKAFDLLYPKLFSRVEKQDLIDLMAGMENDGLMLNMRNVQIQAATAPVSEGKETFVRVDYLADLDVMVKRESLYGDANTLKALEGQFASTYGQRNVKWDADQNAFHIRAHKAMMAIQADGQRDWKLVEINTDQPEMMAYLFSPGVLETLVNVE